MELAAGQNTMIAGHAVTLAGSGVDLTALVLSEDGKVAGDPDMVFFNQPDAPGLTLRGSSLEVDLRRLRVGAAKVVLVASVDTPGRLIGRVTITDSSTSHTFTPSGLTTETAVVLVELYQRTGDWKVRAVGQGYADGLEGLARDFGVDVSEPSVPAPGPSVSLAKPPLGKVSLAKKGSATIPIDLTKPTPVTVHLDWNGGSADRKRRGADLDLYALYVLADGTVGLDYYKTLKNKKRQTAVRLTGDARTPGRESVIISDPSAIRHVAICAYSAVENGTGSFKSYGARAVVDDGRGSQVTVPLFNKSERYWVCIATISTTPEGVVVRQVEDYGTRTTEARPLLHPNGCVEMGAGPVEFKGR